MIVELKPKEDWRDPIAAMEAIVTAMKAGQQDVPDTAVLVFLDAARAPVVFGFGRDAGELQCMAAMDLGKCALIKAYLESDDE